jgi:hypothetical protein
MADEVNRPPSEIFGLCKFQIYRPMTEQIMSSSMLAKMKQMYTDNELDVMFISRCLIKLIYLELVRNT